MKPIIFSILISLMVFSCKKEIDSRPADTSPTASIDPESLRHIKDFLHTQMPDSLFKKLDTTNYSLTKEPPVCYFRMGFKETPMEKQFVLLALEMTGNILSSKIINLDMASTGPSALNGQIRIRQISGKEFMSSVVSNGFVVQWHKQLTERVSTNGTEVNMQMAEEPEYDVLPDVYVYPDYGGGIDYYLLLSSFSGSGSGYSSGAGYAVPGGSGGSGSATYTRAASPSSSSPRVTTNRPQTITVETSYLNPAIKVSDFIKCFSQITDAGASYAITIFADLPVNDDPTQFFNQSAGATGHVFLGLTKTAGAQSVTQYMGFTAVSPLSAIASGSVAGKVVDNSNHKYNASLTTPVSASEFASALNQVQSQSANKYDLQNYNCVDFALGVVNSARGNYPLLIDEYAFPGGSKMSTPEAVYSLITSMARSSGPEAANTHYGGIWNAGTSHGACN